MTGSQSTLLQLLSKALFDRAVNQPDTDWRAVLIEAKNQTVVQLAYAAMDESCVPESDAEQWKVEASASVANSIRVFFQHCLLQKWMSGSGVPYVILKGCASASYYPIPEYRSMGDVDFLVPGERLKQAGRILESNGLKPWDEEHISHIVYRGPQMHYEMHFNLSGTPNGRAGDLIREYTKDIFEKAEQREIGMGSVMLPSPFHHGIVLLLHTCHHLTGEGIGLRHLCDWAVFENSFSDEEFCDLFEEKLKEVGLWQFAQILTRTAIRFLGADEKNWAECDEAVVSALMDDILTGGNFGNKDNSRAIQSMLISERGKSGVGKISMVHQAFKSANEVVYHIWPVARKSKLLLPLGWIYLGIRRFFQELTGKRKKTDMRKLVGGAAARRDLYAKFHLYETEQ